MEPLKHIRLRGVRVHNLKSVDVTIPLHRLTVVAGVSGAGKSSLVFDTLYAEAQRRYLQSFSAYTRQFLERFEKPDAEEISDLPPAVAIRQAPARGTVGTLTEIDAHLGLLFARTGVIICPTCGQPVIAKRTADVVQAMPTGARCTIAFPVTVPPASDQPAWLAALLEEGYVRIQVDAQVHRLGDGTLPELPDGADAWILLDRVEAGKTPAERMTESIDAAFRRGQGRMRVFTDTQPLDFDQRTFCTRCQRLYPDLEPRLFEKHGDAWDPAALAVQVDGRTIADWQREPVATLATWSSTPQIERRLQALASLDLGYVTLQQPATALADGVARRIALASAVAADLVHVLYLVDEPSAGMHPRDLDKLVAALQRLRDRGNTVVVIEHERRIIAAADHIIDIGPNAGEEGGTITYSGPPDGLPDLDEIGIPESRRKPAGSLKLTSDTTVEFPLGVLCVVTGVSGAGKRSLVERTLYPALCAAKKKKCDTTTDAKVSGSQAIADVILLDQTPLARSARSNAATYLKIFDEIRELFAANVDAKIRNFGPGHFSFNQPGGRCETCEGQGTLTIDMQFLADVQTVCPECQGRRYRKEILDIKVRSLSIAQVLDLTIREAFRFFRAQPAIERKLKVLIDVGLDYLRLGQSLDTLAGGECQRLKLAGHLASSRKAGCLFLLLEPSAGLHPDDVANLLECFDRLLAAGHSLIVVDNDMDVIKCADRILDMDAGQVVAQGTPEDVAGVRESPTGQVLAAILNRNELPDDSAE
jgi:excinuclease ABC subunit A